MSIYPPGTYCARIRHTTDYNPYTSATDKLIGDRMRTTITDLDGHDFGLLGKQTLRVEWIGPFYEKPSMDGPGIDEGITIQNAWIILKDLGRTWREINVFDLLPKDLSEIIEDINAKLDADLDP